MAPDSLLHAAQRTASLRHDDECQAVLLNLLLRNYLHYNLYDQADKLVSKTTFPSSAGNPQLSRYHYYLGRIKAVQLNYSAAHTNLQQATRRAPPAKTAPGFFQDVRKLSIVVDLLMGEIPEINLFRQQVLQKALEGYFEIVRGKFEIYIQTSITFSLLHISSHASVGVGVGTVFRGVIIPIILLVQISSQFCAFTLRLQLLRCC